MIKNFGLDRQYITLKDELLEATHQVLASGQLVDGAATQNFEEWLEGRTGAKYVVTVHSGTQALEIIAGYYRRLLCSDLGVISPTIVLPNLTYPATLNAFLTTGWKVQLVDTDSNGIMLLNPVWRLGRPLDMIECPVGLYGARPGEYHSYTSASIIDGAQHWLVSNGNLGYGMAISFDPTKNLPASGNGGAIATNNSALHDWARQYRDNGKGASGAFLIPGTNSKMSDLDCAHLVVRTRYLNEWQGRRKQIDEYWNNSFADLPIRCLSAGVEAHSHQKYAIYTDTRTELIAYLHEHGIETKVNYPYTLSELPYAAAIEVKPTAFSVSMMLSRGVLSLPIYPELTDSEVEHIAKTVISFFKTK
jgi:dTDP-4-amino-4,6-dideoxygalactose transaminase